jgi:phosphoacetylglucosamine mutase
MASQAVKKAITEAALQYTKPDKVFEYGTAGVGSL